MKKYNGWTNYETWRINLEIFDGFNLQHWRLENSSLDYLSQVLRKHVINIIEDCSPEGLARDYAIAFVSDVDYRSIASSMLEDFKGDPK